MFLKKEEAEFYKSRIVSTVINGMEYMRIPEGVTTKSDSGGGEYDQECRTVWFRKGVEDQLLSGQIPEDFMRCPACNGMRLSDYECIDSGSTVCRDCGKAFYDLGWVWMECLFPDERLSSKIAGAGNGNIVRAFMARTCPHDSWYKDYQDETIVCCIECRTERKATTAAKMCATAHSETRDACLIEATEIAKTIEEQTADIPAYRFPDGSNIWQCKCGRYRFEYRAGGCSYCVKESAQK